MIKKVFIDTNVFIYLLEGDPNFAKKAANKLANYRNKGYDLVTSVVTITEFLASNSNSSAIKAITEFPGITFIDIDTAVATKAGELASKHPFKLGDCIQLSAALSVKSDILLTNDIALQKQAKHYLDVVSLAN